MHRKKWGYDSRGSITLALEMLSKMTEPKPGELIDVLNIYLPGGTLIESLYFAPEPSNNDRTVVFNTDNQHWQIFQLNLDAAVKAVKKPGGYNELLNFLNESDRAYRPEDFS